MANTIKDDLIKNDADPFTKPFTSGQTPAAETAPPAMNPDVDFIPEDDLPDEGERPDGTPGIGGAGGDDGVGGQRG